MKRLLLIRTIGSDDGTFGHLVHGDFHVVTAEPEASRAGNKGRIPPGTYRANWEPTGRLKGYALTGVPGFENVELHAGNTEDDTRGCILVGHRRGRLNGKEAVLNSRVALKRMERYLNHKPFELEIIERIIGESTGLHL